MNHPRLLLLLILALAAALAVAFWPDDATELEIDPAAKESLAELDQAVAEAGAVEEAKAQTEIENNQGRAVAVADSQSEVDDPQAKVEEQPYAELLVRLYGENDAILADATAGILLMPEPGNDFKNLQPLFFAMQGRAPKSFALIEAKPDENGEVILPLPKHKHGWVVYGRAFGRLVGFKIVNDIGAGERHDAGVLVLHRGGSLRVEVSDENGDAVVNANVLLVSQDNSDPTEMPLHFLRTDAAGVAEFHSLNFQRYEMDVAKPGYDFIDKKDVAITERGEGLEQVVLSRGGTISGSIVDHLDQPMAGIPIALRAEKRQHRPQGLTEDLMRDQQWALSDEHGQFEGRGLRADVPYSISASPSDEVTVRSSGHKVGDHVKLKVNPVVPFRGRIVQADGTPAAGAWIQMHPAGPSKHIVQMKTTSDGTFAGEVFRGNYWLIAHHETGEYIHPNLLRLNREQQMPDIMLPNGGSLSLTFLKPDGSPVEQVFLNELQSVERSGADKRTRDLLDHLGRLRRKDIIQRGNHCRIDGLNPGAVQLRFYVKDYLDPWLDLEVKAGQLVEREITVEESGSLRLRITGPEDFEPNKLVYVLTYADPVAPRHQRLRRTIRFLVSKSGEVRRQDLLPGTWIVSVAEDAKPNLGATPGAELGRFTIVAGDQERSVEIR